MTRAPSRSRPSRRTSPHRRVSIAHCCDRQERFGVLQQGLGVAALSFGPRGEVRDGAIQPGFEIVGSAEAVADTVREEMARLALHDQSPSGEHHQRRLQIRNVRDSRDVLHPQWHTRQRGQCQQRPPLLVVDSKPSAP